ncbi:hypothetical protein I3842_16G087900 [Carya illinoinensis]|uniref:Uncharacterized protein n=1 Tax=Carya illinoinensis TaxID=32201 RepID=A0A922A103_CARIL|nr:hypothetical protein I3842_16G087900 [Carya illinoinensis]
MVQKTDASCCNFRLLSEKWMCKLKEYKKF